MKKGKYIDHYVVMACLSNVRASATQSIDELLSSVLKKTGCEELSSVKFIETKVSEAAVFV